jgi:hypothetical protein
MEGSLAEMNGGWLLEPTAFFGTEIFMCVIKCRYHATVANATLQEVSGPPHCQGANQLGRPA